MTAGYPVDGLKKKKNTDSSRCNVRISFFHMYIMQIVKEISHIAPIVFHTFTHCSHQLDSPVCRATESSRYHLSNSVFNNLSIKMDRFSRLKYHSNFSIFSIEQLLSIFICRFFFSLAAHFFLVATA